MNYAYIRGSHLENCLKKKQPKNFPKTNKTGIHHSFNSNPTRRTQNNQPKTSNIIDLQYNVSSF